MRNNYLFANLKKCVFSAEEIPLHGCFVGKDGVRQDPVKVKLIACQLAAPGKPQRSTQVVGTGELPSPVQHELR